MALFSWNAVIVFLVFLLRYCTAEGQFQTVAFTKTCHQSSYYRSGSNRHECTLAINGVKTGSYNNNPLNCIHTNTYPYDWNPYWQGDLGQSYPIHHIVVWGRNEDGTLVRMSGCEIKVEGNLCYTFGTVAANHNQRFEITCNTPLSGQIIRVEKNTSSSIQGGWNDDYTINMCEIEVYVCHDGYWGSDCDKACHHPCSQMCNKETGLCPNGYWGAWGSYSQCSLTCGGGYQTRTRPCNGGTYCPGSHIETQGCNKNPCPVDGNWGSWGQYGSCSATCGYSGTQTRNRYCDSPAPDHGGRGCTGGNTETQSCNRKECPNWGQWGTWGTCSQACGGGTQSRTRQCYNSNNGACGGNDWETKTCNEGLCPVNGQWGSWQSWGNCSATCGGGSQSRSRQCDNPPRANGGADCPGNETERQDCNTFPCSCGDGKYLFQHTTCTPCGSGCKNANCDFYTGDCTCSPGWIPPNCTNQCGFGKYGLNCSETCGVGCINGTCAPGSGKCDCYVGFEPDLCNKVCTRGKYGAGCRTLCAGGCNDSCNNTDGYCTCKPGWNGTLCDIDIRPAEALSDVPTAAIGGAAAGAVVAIAVVVVIVVVVVRRRRSNGGKASGPRAPKERGSRQPSSSMVDMSNIYQNVSNDMVASARASKPAARVKPNNTQGQTASMYVNTANDDNCRPSTSSQADDDDGHYKDVTKHQKKAPIPLPRRDETKPSTSQNDDANNMYAVVNKLQNGGHNPASRRDVTVSSASQNDDMYAVVNKPQNGATAHTSVAGDGYTVVSDGKSDTKPKPPAKPAILKRKKAKVEEVVADVADDDVEDVEDVDVEAEAEKNYDVTSLREKVYYNDGVYMTSQGSELKLDDLQQKILDKLRGDVIDEEFESLHEGFSKPHDTGELEENYYRNRFNSILPYEDNRVVLRGKPDPNCNDYINASYIRGRKSPKAYIAAQGPRPNTVADFWKMVSQDHVTHIVMLTNLKEGKKKKCHMYWPGPMGKTAKHGSCDVTAIDTQDRANYVIRIFEVKPKKGERYQVTQFHYTTWPDHGIPTTTALVDFWRTVHTSVAAQKSTAPLLVHCSAGVGRTGTFIALDILMDQVQHQQQHHHQQQQQQHDVDILQVVRTLRDDRCNMVQAKTQYRSVHEAFLEAYTCRDSRLDLLTFDSIYKHPVNPQYRNTRIDTEFKKLKQMKLLLQKPDHSEAEKRENINKNRFLDILPGDVHRVLLEDEVDDAGRTDYINAVWLPTFTDQQGVAVTQLPLPDTIVDLWRLVAGYDVTRVVSLECETQDGEKKNCYWPTAVKQTASYGPSSVQLKSVSPVGQHIKHYKLSLNTQGRKEVRDVSVYHYGEWSGEVAGSTQDLLQLVDLVLTSQAASSTPLLVQCKDGATQCGLFCAICDVISRMTSDREVDVYTAVRNIHNVRPECLTSEVQYRFIYHVVQEFRQRNDTYNNA